MKKTLTERNSKVLLLIGILLFLFGIIIFLFRENINVNSKIDANKIAQFGDFIGGVVGSLWSLAGVILFYVALTEQRKDIVINREALNAQVSALNQQIEEFELQREELSETRKVFQEQSETLKIQRFENTFFQLLNLHHELIDKLNFNRPENFGGTKLLEKRAVLYKAFEDLEFKLKQSNKIWEENRFGEDVIMENPPETIKIAEERMTKAYREFHFGDYKQILNHYFRNVYHIFKFIYLSELIENSKKQFYASIVRAQLSSDELYLIFYNSMQNGLGYPNFSFLINEFDLMQNFDFRIIKRLPFHKDIYNMKIKDLKPTFGVKN